VVETSRNPHLVGVECGVPITVRSLRLLLVLCLMSGLFSVPSVEINVLKKAPRALSLSVKWSETQVIECELVNMIIDLHNLLNLPLALSVRWRKQGALRWHNADGTWLPQGSTALNLSHASFSFSPSSKATQMTPDPYARVSYSDVSRC
jgi:hypothetical protein